jgi:hypothetical protein
MNLPTLEKALTHLRNKLVKNKSFYITDFDLVCLDSLITFYNVVEREIKLENQLFYQLIYIIIRYEIINKRLNEDKQPFSILDIFQRIEKLLSSDIETESVKMLLECQAQKTSNFLNSGTELTSENINKLHFSTENENRAFEMINNFILKTILNNDKNNKRGRQE